MCLTLGFQREFVMYFGRSLHTLKEKVTTFPNLQALPVHVPGWEKKKASCAQFQERRHRWTYTGGAPPSSQPSLIQGRPNEKVKKPEPTEGREVGTIREERLELVGRPHVAKREGVRKKKLWGCYVLRAQWSGGWELGLGWIGWNILSLKYAPLKPIVHYEYILFLLLYKPNIYHNHLYMMDIYNIDWKYQDYKNCMFVSEVLDQENVLFLISREEKKVSKDYFQENLKTLAPLFRMGAWVPVLVKGPYMAGSKVMKKKIIEGFTTFSSSSTKLKNWEGSTNQIQGNKKKTLRSKSTSTCEDILRASCRWRITK